MVEVGVLLKFLIYWLWCYQTEMHTLLTYISLLLGYYDQQYRNNLFNYWCTHLQQAGIMFRADLARTEVKLCFNFLILMWLMFFYFYVCLKLFCPISFVLCITVLIKCGWTFEMASQCSAFRWLMYRECYNAEAI